MQKLDRKLTRDLSLMKGQVAAIVLVIAAGVATFVMSVCAYQTLDAGKNRYYRDFRFADVFSSVKRAPNHVVPRAESLPGVSAVQTRLVCDVLLSVPELPEPATARLISMPDIGEQKLNRIYIARGRMIEPGRSGEVVVSESFADAHQFRSGDTVDAVINGKMQRLKIVGVALSPEYIIQLQGGNMLPDDKRFGVFWMSHRELEAAFDMSGAFNEITVKLSRNANAAEVIELLDQLLEPYGSLGATDRSQHLSHQYVTDELFQLRTMATVAPAIFLSVAAFQLNIVISRIVSRQREQIAALKAFGYSNWEVGMHYLNLVLLISLTGTAAGVFSGVWMADHLVELYQKYYRFPMMEFRVSVVGVVAAFLLTTIAATGGTWLAVRRAIALPPAEAMRPEPPAVFRTTWIEQIVPAGLMPSGFRMIVRNVARKPVKSVFSIVGVGMAVAVLVLGSFSLDALDYLIDFQFRKAQRQDIAVTFVEPATASVLHEVASLDGVLDSETIRGVATRILDNYRDRRVGIVGLSEEPRLFRLLDGQAEPVSVPSHGIMLNSKLAQLLDARTGDFVTLEILEGKRPTIDVEVTAIVEEYGGVNAYMHKPRLHKLLGESTVASGAFLRVDHNRVDQVFGELETRPGVSSVSVKDAAIDSFKDTIAENMLTMRSFNIMFAMVIAIGVVYNTARISLSEQSRDLATMRVIGFSEREVSSVLLGEIFLFTLLAIPVGWLIGYGMASAMILGLDTENYRIPLIISRSTFAFAAIVVILATFVSAMIVRRRINKLNLISVLKTRE